MPRLNRFRHQTYRSEPPASSYRLLSSGPPSDPASREFADRMDAAGGRFRAAGVAAVYLVHGTFTGNDALGLITELARYAPRMAASLRKVAKRTFDAIIGETGNYTPDFAARMQTGLNRPSGDAPHAAGGAAEPPLPVRLFHWASQNHHLSRADAAVRLLDELAQLATQHSAKGSLRMPTPRALLWAHSHGGNVFALATNLLGADAPARAEFFQAGQVFHRSLWSSGVDFPVWPRVEQLLSQPDHPVRRLELDFVTFGTPVRYGWDADGYSKLLHIVNHRPDATRGEHRAHYPPRFRRILAGRGGDFMQHLGVAGTNFPPLPLAWRTFLADRRLGRLFERSLPRQWLRTRLMHGMRIADDGTTLLVDYDDPDRSPLRHLLGHAPYTRSRWLPLHCELVAESFYGQPPRML
jgi:hypothetical protein